MADNCFSFNKSLSDEHYKIVSKFIKKHDNGNGSDHTPDSACEWQCEIDYA